MESPLELPIFIHYRPSKRVGMFNALVHAGAIFCLFLSDIPATATVLIGTAVLTNYGFYLKPVPVSGGRLFQTDRHDRWQLLQGNRDAGNRDAVDLRLLPGRASSPEDHSPVLQGTVRPDPLLRADP